MGRAGVIAPLPLRDSARVASRSSLFGSKAAVGVSRGAGGALAGRDTSAAGGPPGAGVDANDDMTDEGVAPPSVAAVEEPSRPIITRARPKSMTRTWPSAPIMTLSGLK